MLITFWPLDWWLGTPGALIIEGTWWSIVAKLHRNLLEKTILRFGWTWESNPGPSSYHARHQPPSHFVVFVNIICNKYNVRKETSHMLKQKEARVFEWSSEVLPAHRLLHETCRKTCQIAGVLNPLKIQMPKIAIRPVHYINRARGVQWIRLILTNLTIAMRSSDFAYAVKP